MSKERTEEHKKLPCENSLELNVIDALQGAGCSCIMSNINLSEVDRIGDMINQMLKGRIYSKATIKLDIKFHEN